MSAQKVVLITASSAGLGAQIARVFAADFRVVSQLAHGLDTDTNLVSGSSSTVKYRHDGVFPNAGSR